jgi:3-hydroxybutyryl-CoA dehydratase
VTATWPPVPEVTHTIGRAEIDAYAHLSGDFNPLHMNAEYAAKTQFGTVIAHGPVGLQTVFEAVATWLGGDRLPSGVRVDVSYRGPVRIGDSVTCRAENVDDQAGDVTVRLRCVNQDGTEVLQALVVVPRLAAPRAQ